MHSFPVYVGHPDGELFLDLMWIHQERAWHCDVPGGRLCCRGMECRLLTTENIVRRLMGEGP